MYNVTVNPSAEDLTKATEHELFTYYAAKTSVNPNLDIPSVPPVMDQVLKDTVDKYGNYVAAMAVTDYQGILQNFFVGLIGAKRILEIGSFTGSSAIYFSNALMRNGVKPGPDANGNKPITGLDISEEFTGHARANIDKAGVTDYVNIIVGDARQSLTSLIGQTYDIVFIDADKTSYKFYYDTVIKNNMLAKNGLMIVDNTALWGVPKFIGKPTDDAETAAIIKTPYLECTKEQVGRALHDFNEYIRADSRTETIMFPIFTGMTFVRLL
ncbi:hypothetical protein LPJ53_000812 [Coemansia erecta]|uniref:S-adenosyl-L-methionine-dependent methyltransferase n=1 Tax=Coemansia erecta TaxID=147472 RepID=A0A9W7Y6P7_9FUNG|nr:hypothetical protein LPJ53_000812 [Coemansia erecta]